MPAGLVALALGGFGIGLTEFVIAGLLPQVARSLAVSEAAAGRLISGYALTVAIGAMAVTAATARLPRKPVQTGLAALVAVGHLRSALAPTPPGLLLGRVGAPLCHGTLLGTGRLVAPGGGRGPGAEIVRPEGPLRSLPPPPAGRRRHLPDAAPGQGRRG